MKNYDSRPETYKHIRTVQALLGRAINELLERSRVHDLSKLEEPELSVFDEYTPKLAGSTYGSDEYKEFLKGMNRGLEHHYFHNRHHPEYFAFEGVALYPQELETGRAIQRMNLLDLLEMLCDWKAATMRHDDGDIRKSIEINQTRFGYSDELKQILINTLPMIVGAPPMSANDMHGHVMETDTPEPIAALNEGEGK